jgi:hypothetical protein
MLVSSLKDRRSQDGSERNKERIVNKLISWIAAAAFAVPLLITASGDAQAHRYRHHGGDAAAAGIAAAVIGGIILSQVGRRHHRYYYDDYDDYDYGYYSRPRYYSSYGYYPRRYYGGGWGLGRHYGHHGGGLRVRGGHFRHH